MLLLPFGVLVGGLFDMTAARIWGQSDLYRGQQSFSFGVRGSRGASKTYLVVKVQLETVE